jgi:hypothetical protein
MAWNVIEDKRRAGARKREMSGDLELGIGRRVDELKRPPLG